MHAPMGLKHVISRRTVAKAAGLVIAQIVLTARAETANTPTDKFDFLSTHGNSSCTGEFLNSIATMPPGARPPVHVITENSLPR